MLCQLHQLIDAVTLRAIDELLDDAAFDDGAASAGFRARRVKRNQQMSGGDAKRQVEELVLDALEAHSVFQRAALPLVIKAPIISRYRPEMEYGAHVDDAVMGGGDPMRADIAVTVFLSAPQRYDGGELTLSSPFGETRVKLPRGDAVMYPANTVHRVAPVTQGERLAAVTWVQSQVRDPGARELLYDLHQVAAAMHEQLPDSPQTTLAFKSYSNLLRRWSEL